MAEPEAGDEFAEAVSREILARDAVTRHLGIHLEEVRAGYARVRMHVDARMLNGHGTCHGGMLFTLGDTAFGYACNSRNLATVASGCSIDFLAPAHLGDTLTAVAEETSLTGRTGVYDVIITNQHGGRVALFRGRSYRVKGLAAPALAAGDEGQ